jgi:uroporphyrin-III C-methyltransferase/precorrin-2 dehydrogenase/sirohydrochlorin ferrochelatase
MSVDDHRRWPYPIFLDLSDEPVVVIGGGAVAERKIEALIAAGARITVVSPEVTGLIATWADEGRLTLHSRPYRQGDLAGFRLAYAATSAPDVNQAVRDEARAEGVWLNAIDKPALCDFITPATVRRGDLTLAVSTNGRCPALAKQIREDLECTYGPEYTDTLKQLGELRDRAKAGAGPTANVDAAVADLLAALPSTPPRLREAGVEASATSGKVYLIGAGPGDPELLTIKGRRLLACADTVVYDALVDSRLLEFCPPSTTRLYVGKLNRHHTRSQAEINTLLIDEAKAGRIVVRLKGGDPFVFGRGGEEAEALVEAGIAYEVVPGVSAGVAVPAYAGIPLTHRGITGEVVFLTGHESETTPSPVDWIHCARSSATLVIFMGLDNLDAIARRLLDLGRDAHCPVAVIENGTTGAQRTIVAPLSEIAAEAAGAGARAPALIVVGEVVALRHRLQWFEQTREGGPAVK